MKVQASSGLAKRVKQPIRSGLMQSAHVAARSHTYLAAQYRRIAARRGKKHDGSCSLILVIAYHLIQRQEPYRELGANYFDQQCNDHPNSSIVSSKWAIK